MVGFRRERTIDGDDVGAPEDIRKGHKLDAQFGCKLWIGVGVVGDEFHIERLGEPEHLGANVADANGPERSPDEPQAHVLRPPVEPRGTHARQAILDHKPAGESEKQGEDGYCYRTANAVWSYDQGNGGLGQGADIDVIVTDAEARDDTEAAGGMNAFTRETRNEQDQRIEVGDLARFDRTRRLNELHFHAGGRLKRAQVEIGKRRRPILFSEITRKGDAEFVRHAQFPAWPWTWVCTWREAPKSLRQERYATPIHRQNSR